MVDVSSGTGAVYSINVVGIGELVVHNAAGTINILQPYTNASGKQAVKAYTIEQYYEALRNDQELNHQFKDSRGNAGGKTNFTKAITEASTSAAKRDGVVALDGNAHGIGTADAMKNSYYALKALQQVQFRGDEFTLKASYNNLDKSGSDKSEVKEVGVTRDRATGKIKVTSELAHLAETVIRGGSYPVLQTQNVERSNSGGGYVASYNDNVKGGKLKVSGVDLDVRFAVQPIATNDNDGSKTAKAVLTVGNQTFDVVLKPVSSGTPPVINTFAIDDGGDKEFTTPGGKRIKVSEVIAAIDTQGHLKELYTLSAKSEADLQTLTSIINPKLQANEGGLIVSNLSLSSYDQANGDRYGVFDMLMFARKNGKTYVGIGRLESDRVTPPTQYYELGDFVDALASNNNKSRSDIVNALKAGTIEYGAVDKDSQYSKSKLDGIVTAHTNLNAGYTEDKDKALEYLRKPLFKVDTLSVVNAPFAASQSGEKSSAQSQGNGGFGNNPPAAQQQGGSEEEIRLANARAEAARAEERAANARAEAARAEAQAKGGHQPSNKTDTDKKEPPAMKSEGVGGILGVMMAAFGIGASVVGGATGNAQFGTMAGGLFALTAFLMRDKPMVANFIDLLNKGLSAPAQSQTVGT